MSSNQGTSEFSLRRLKQIRLAHRKCRADSTHRECFQIASKAVKKRQEKVYPKFVKKQKSSIKESDVVKAFEKILNIK